MVGRALLGLILLSAPSGAQAPQGQEIVLETTQGARLAIAVPRPAVSGVNEGKVSTDFHAVLQRDLSDSGKFAVLKDGLPSATDPSSFKAWSDAGAEWLLAANVNATSEGIEVVVQVSDVKTGQDRKARTAVFSKRYTGKEAALRRMAHKLADDLVARLTGQAGVAGTSIVFVRQVGPGIKEIYQMDRDGANVAPLTAYRSLTISPSVAPDGRLAFVTYKGGGPEIWGQRTPGGAMVRLYPLSGKVDGHCFCPMWSPDGRRLAFTQGDRRGNTDIMVLDLHSGKVRQLTNSNCLNTDPSWNPTGTQLAFTSDKDGTPQVYLMEEDGSNVRRLTREGNYNGSPAWSPGGTMIAYVSRFEGKFDLFVYKLADGKSYQVTTGVASSESPSWSPDESRIVFSSGSRGGMQLYSTDLSGSTLRKLTELDGCQSPKWTRSR